SSNRMPIARWPSLIMASSWPMAAMPSKAMPSIFCTTRRYETPIWAPRPKNKWRRRSQCKCATLAVECELTEEYSMKRLTAIIAGAATALLLGSAVMLPAMAQDDTIEIGVIAPLTGRNAVQGKDIVQGIKLAVQRVNEGYDVPQEDGSTIRVDPEALGGKIELIVEDTESRPESAVDAVRKLVNVDKVPLVLGVLSSGVCVPTGPFTNKNKVVQIAAACTSPKLRE